MELQIKKTKKRSVWKKILIGILCLPLLMIAFGASYEAIASYQGVKKYPPEGKLVDVGGFKLHLHKQGEGGPVIILETGSGGSSISWGDIPRELSNYGTVVTYDRGGYAWSEKAETDRTGENIVRELYTALKKEKIEGPYILVGHSLGGMYTRLFAQTYKDEVAGLVLLDSRPGDYSKETDSILLDAGVDPILMGSLSKNVTSFLKGIGFIRLLLGEDSFTDIPEEYRNRAMNIDFRSKFFSAKEDELRNMAGVEDSIRSQALGDIPLAVVTHGIPLDLTIIGLSKQDSSTMEEIWQEQQKETLGLSTRSELIVAKNSGHGIMIDEPELVVDVIKAMVEDVKK